MNDPEWAEILEYLYTNTAGVEEHREQIEADWSKDTKATKQKVWLEEQLIEQIGLEIDQDGMQETLNRMEKWGLIDRFSDTTYSTIVLTDDGMQIAHERDLSNKQESTNRLLAVFTILLFFAAMLQAGVGVMSLGASQSVLVILIAGVITIVGAIAFRDYF